MQGSEGRAEFGLGGEETDGLNARRMCNVHAPPLEVGGASSVDSDSSDKLGVLKERDRRENNEKVTTRPSKRRYKVLALWR